MAYGTGNNEQGNKQQTNNNEFRQEQNNGGNFERQETKMSFGSSPFKSFSMSAGDLSKAVESLKELFKQDKSVLVIPLDKMETELRYSSVLTVKYFEDRIGYFVTLLESSDREPLTVSAMIEEYKNKFNTTFGSNARFSGFTAEDAIDAKLKEVAVYKIRERLGPDVLPVMTGSLVIPYEVKLEDAHIKEIAEISYNSIVRWLSNNETGIKINSNTNLNLNLSVGDTTQSLFSTKRSDLKARLVSFTNSSNDLSPNAGSGNSNLAEVSGYIDAIPSNIKDNIGNVKTRFHPTVILNNISVFEPSVVNLILALNTGLVLTDPKNFAAGLLGKNDIGALNKFAIFDGQNNDALSTKGNDTSKQDVYAYATEVFSLNPILAIDVRECDENGSLLTAIKLGSSNAVSENVRENATKYLVDGINQLTNSKFGTAKSGEVFAGSIEIPVGTFIDQNGNEKDLAEIDSIYIAEHADVQTFSRWMAASVPNSNVDSYTTRLDIISQIIPTAIIRGKATRVFFTGAFISKLNSSISLAGISPSYNALVPDYGNTFAGSIASFDNSLQSAAFNGNLTGFNSNTGGNTFHNPYTGNVANGIFN